MSAVGSGVQVGTVLRFLDLAVDALGQAREEIDALNVYPVPDADTGTNLYLTVAAAREALRAASAQDPETALAALARGALLGARGNSGVVLSEMLGAVARRIGSAGPTERNGAVLVDALGRASAASYAAVGRPVEGTMLTVARAAAEAAAELLDGRPGVRSRDVLEAAAAAARAALARTPDQLAALRDAGVVDAGGRGICVLLDAAESAVSGRRPPVAPTGSPAALQASGGQADGPGDGPADGPAHGPADEPAGDLVPGGPAYEVMYLLDAADDRVPGLRTTLDGLGDSLVVVGGDGLWNVHVHVDDVGAAVEAGIEAGRPHRIRVTHFADQADRADRALRTGSHAPPRRRAVVAVAAGPGLARLFADAGAIVVTPHPGLRLSTGELVEAIDASGADEVVLLPNDPDSLRVARVAASTVQTDSSTRVAVVATTSQVEGLAAMAVHEARRGLDQDVLEMTATARHTRQGAVTIAARDAMTMAGPCRSGDVLGAVQGDFVVVGGTLLEAAVDVLARLLGPGGELVTVVAGQAAGSRALADQVAAWVQERHPTVDVVVYDGGQQRYPLLMSVE